MDCLKSYELLLPDRIPAVTGKEINVYFDNLIYGDSRRCDFEVSCPIGKHMNDRWTAVPQQAGDYPLQITVCNDEGESLCSAASTIHVVDRNAGAGMRRHALFIGDSTTANGVFTGELLQLFANDVMQLKLAGTHGEAPNVNEGRSGWKVADFYERADSPFRFQDRFDFASYMATHGIADLTDVIIHLGINEVYGVQEEAGMDALIAKEIPMLDEMMDSIRSYDHAIRIGVALVIPPAREQDSFGNSYGTLQSRRRYRKHLYRWNIALQQRYGGKTAESICVIPLHVNLDTLHHMPTRSEPLNSRSTVQAVRQCDDVHPSIAGYGQMADVLYYWFKSHV